jgi:hypothetical protein
MPVAVKSCVVPSEKVPVAVSCTVVSLASEGFTGVITIEARTAGVTVTVVDPETPALVAVMVAVPTLIVVTEPPMPALPTTATVGDDECQAAVFVRSCAVASEKVPVAVSCTLLPWAMEGFAGATRIELRVADVTVTLVEPETPA